MNIVSVNYIQCLRTHINNTHTYIFQPDCTY